MPMTNSLIPDDKLIRRQLAKILAQMIKDDFEKARAQRDSGEPINVAKINEGDGRR
jgi:hypothetical protein